MLANWPYKMYWPSMLHWPNKPYWPTLYWPYKPYWPPQTVLAHWPYKLYEQLTAQTGPTNQPYIPTVHLPTRLWDPTEPHSQYARTLYHCQWYLAINWTCSLCVCGQLDPRKFGRDLVDTTFHASCKMRDGVTYRHTFPMSWREGNEGWSGWNTLELARVKYALTTPSRGLYLSATLKLNTLLESHLLHVQ